MIQCGTLPYALLPRIPGGCHPAGLFIYGITFSRCHGGKDIAHCLHPLAEPSRSRFSGRR